MSKPGNPNKMQTTTGQPFRPFFGGGLISSPHPLIRIKPLALQYNASIIPLRLGDEEEPTRGRHNIAQLI